MSSRSVIGRNILANALGGSWVVILNLVVIPFQLRILGPEAFGLIGFLASLQAFLSVLDLGLSTTVNREIAADVSQDRTYSRLLVETAAGLYWIVTVFLGLALTLGSEILTTRWLTLEAMTPQEAAGAIRIMAVWMAFTWPTALYASVLTGLQRLDVVNGLRVASVTLSQGGGLVVLLLWRDFHLFLYWLAGTALISVAVHAFVCRLISPWMSLRLRPTMNVIRRVWRFSLDVNLISVLAIVYTQMDRLILGKLLPLRMLGYYNVAYSLTKGIGTIQGFVNSAVLPALASDFGHWRMEELKARYSKYSQALVYLVTLPAFFLLFYGFDVLRYWATPEVAGAGHRTLQILAAGFLLNAAMSAPYTLSIATGHTKLPLLVNLVGVGIYVPALYRLTVSWGLEGAALAWLGLNLYYLATLMPLTQRLVMHAGASGWLRANLVPFGLLGLAAFGLAWTLAAGDGGESVMIKAVAATVAAATYAAGGYLLLAPALRMNVRSLLSIAWHAIAPKRSV